MNGYKYIGAEFLKLIGKYPAYKNRIIIFDELKLIYINNSKVACTSIKNIIAKNIAEERYNLYNPQDIHKIFEKDKRVFINIPRSKINYYKFTFVRNPFSRLVSCYKSKIVDLPDRQKDFDKYSFLFGLIQPIKKGMTFENFIGIIYKIPDFYAEKHFKSQFSFLYKNSRCIVDYIGRFENIETDFEEIRKKYHFKALPHYNKTVKDDWRNYYNIELAGLVYKRYKRDFDTWYPNAYAALVKYLLKRKINTQS